ncbi:MAG TPA: hypothetical protein VH044_13465 [Polyangiaceae bacterium]|nr:hypothetical protein [Polyangiaceae bacterium]
MTAATGATQTAADGDPLALLPGSAIAVIGVDAKAMYASGAVGSMIGSFADTYVPLGDDAGFQASRDVDHVFLGAYASSSADVAIVLVGRFDTAKISNATRTKAGGALVKGTYAGFVTQTSGPITVAPLTAKTLIGGTTERVHRVLDRLGPSQPALQRAVPPWVASTLASQGAQFAVAADFSTQPIASAAIGSINLTFVQGLRMIRGIGDFDAPGLNVAATLTYGDATQAQSAADNMHMMDNWQKLLAPLLLGAKLSNFQVGTSDADVSCKFALDEGSLQALLTLATKYLQPPAP